MKQIFYTFFFLFLISSAAQAQDSQTDPTIKWGDNNDWPEDFFYNRKLAGKIKGKYYCIAVKDKAGLSAKSIPYLEVFERDGRFLQRSPISLPGGRTYEDVFEFNRTLYMVTSEYNNEKNKKSAFMQPLDLEFFRLGGKEKRVGTVSALDPLDKLYFFHSVSPNGQKIGFCLMPEDPKSKSKTGVRVTMYHTVDGRFKRGYSKNIKLKYKYPSVKVKDIVTNDMGDIFALLTGGGVQDKELELDPIQMTIAGFTHMGDSIKEHKPMLDGKNIIGGFITNAGKGGGNGDFAVTALFREGDEKRLDGAVNFIYDRNGAMKASEKKDKLWKLPKQLTSGKAENKKSKGWEAVSRKVARPLKGHYLISELYHDPSNSGAKHEAYHYYDIIVTAVDNEGKLEWVTMVPKFQETDDDDGRFHSYLPVLAGDRLILLMNDVQESFEARDSESLSKFEGEDTSLGDGPSCVKVIINKEGVWVKKHIFVDGATDGILVPKASMYKNGEAVIQIKSLEEETYKYGFKKFEDEY